ncbi:MAG: DegV family protein, partial [Trichococcus flocculiformis]
MSEFILSSCSTADLTEKHFNSRGINYVCFHFMVDGKEYKDDLGKSISYDDFYKAMSNGAETKTSQVNVGEFVDYFSSFLKEGKDILHVSLSSGLSGVYNSACAAKQLLEAEYPDRKIYIVDSLAASSGYGLLMDKLADLRDDGYTLEQLYDWVENNKLNLHHWFFSTDLSFYVKGGRISKTSGFVGTTFKICPLLNMDENGKLTPQQKVRGKRRVISLIVDKMKNHAIKDLEYSDKCY